jgi:hypothetical protein
MQSISLGAGPVTGVLEGPSRNEIVSCGVPTPGPDAFFSLVLDAYALVDLRVDSPTDTYIAVLACGPNASPWSCSEPAAGGADGGLGDGGVGDAGAPSDASPDAATDLRTTRLRVPLPAGHYTLIVDTASSDAAAAPFTLWASVAAPASNSLCATPTAVDATTPTLHENLSLAGPPVGACFEATSSLYYSVDVRPGQQLTVRADAKAGNQDWTPRVAAFDACDATACLARGSAQAGPDQTLDWINNGSTSRTVLLSVSADGPVMAAEFDLTVGLTDLLTTCDNPTPVHDGTKLSNQSFAHLPPPTIAPCTRSQTPALYYAATLLPSQELDVTALSNGQPMMDIGLRMSCQGACLTTGNPVSLVNRSLSAETVLIEVTRPDNGGDSFDLTVSLPPLP